MNESTRLAGEALSRRILDLERQLAEAQERIEDGKAWIATAKKLTWRVSELELALVEASDREVRLRERLEDVLAVWDDTSSDLSSHGEAFEAELLYRGHIDEIRAALAPEASS
jgi:predicted RNase H-like nuclease (RuvC/YqgF family)